jgi:hypothetical protein
LKRHERCGCDSKDDLREQYCDFHCESPFFKKLRRIVAKGLLLCSREFS